MIKIFLVLGSAFGLIGVMAGALGAHAFKARLESHGGLDNFFRAADYFFVHGLALIATALLISRYPEAKFHWAAWAFVAGSLLFQGSLMGMGLTGAVFMRHLAPVGGLCLMAGWLLLMASAFRL